MIAAFGAVLWMLAPPAFAQTGVIRPQVLRAPGVVAGGDTASITFDAGLATRCVVTFRGPGRAKSGPFRQKLRGGILRASFRVNRKSARGAWRGRIACTTGARTRASGVTIRVKGKGRRTRGALIARRSFRFGVARRSSDSVAQTLSDQKNDQPPATLELGAGPYDNARIADIALSRLGRWAGQCKQAVNDWVREASGGGQRLGGNYFSNYAAQGGIQVGRDQAVKGDIIQLHNAADERGYYWPMHTAVVLSHQPGSSAFEVVDSNYKGDEIVRRHTYDPYKAAGGRLRVTIWRMGTAAGGGGTPGSAAPANGASDGGAPPVPPTTAPSGTPSGSAGTTRSDYNGDGKTDMAWYEYANGAGNITAFLSTGSGFGLQQWARSIGPPTIGLPGDFNGDGKTDIAWYEQSSAEIAMFLSTSSGFALSRWAQGIGKADYSTAGDFNGDGKTDIAWYEYAGGKGNIAMFLSTGSGFALSQWATAIGPPDFIG